MSAIDLEGSVVVVTGGSQGLGRAMAIGLAGAGARVVLVSIDREKLESVAQEIAQQMGHDRALPVLADITRELDCKNVVGRTLETFGELSALVNNARQIPPEEKSAFWESPAEFWESSIRVNVYGTYLMTRSVAPLMLRRGWGRIVNISTSLDTMQRKHYSPYGVTKAAIDAETTIWAQDLEGTGVTVNTLIPGGACDTRAVRRSGAARDGMLLPPNVMVPPVVWLVSKLSDGCTGGRYVAKHWEAGLPPGEAAAKCMELSVFRPPSLAS